MLAISNISCCGTLIQSSSAEIPIAALEAGSKRAFLLETRTLLAHRSVNAHPRVHPNVLPGTPPVAAKQLLSMPPCSTSRLISYPCYGLDVEFHFIFIP